MKFFLIILISLSTSVFSNEHIIKNANAPLLSGLGDYTFKISSKVNGVQDYFDQGIIMSYAFNHAESIRSFQAAQRLDPNCAICFWGEALALGPNINVRSDGKVVMNSNQRILAFKAANKAMSLINNATKVEQDLIRSLMPRYNGDVESSRVPLDIAYAQSMEKLTKKYPYNMDFLSLYAESMMNNMPWNYWLDNGDPKLETVKVINSLEKVLETNPNHPLAIHLYIHAVEASSNPGRAEEAADRLANIVPGAGHLVHMPSHIYWRIGRYNDASEANIAAAKVDEDYIAQCNAQGFYPALYYPHNIHFLWASSAMEGRSDLSIDSGLKVSKYVPIEQIKQIPFLEFFHTVPLLSYIRFGKWDEILNYPKPIDEFSYSNAIYHYARSSAYAALNMSDDAINEQKKILDSLDSSRVKLMMQSGHPTSELIKIANYLSMGNIEMSNNNYSNAINLYKKAANIQDKLPYTEPPFWYYPTRQSLGHAYLMNKDFLKAKEVYKRDLIDYPKNGWSMFGLYKSYTELNETKNAKITKEKFNQIWSNSDIEISSSIIL